MAQSPHRRSSRPTSFPGGTAPGPGVDAQGRVTVDPTRNVLDLVDAAVQRQDDLRELETTHGHELRALNTSHVAEVLKLRAEFTDQLREKESARLDAIRQVDRDTVSRAAEVQTVAAGTLAQQVATSADAVRLNLDTKVAPILEAIAALQRAQYETAGGTIQKQETRSDSGNRGMWLGVVVAVVVGFGGMSISFLIAAVAVAAFFLKK